GSARNSSMTSRHRTASYGMALFSLEQTVAQKPTGSMQPDLGGRFGDAEFGGDLIVGKFVDVAQHHHLAQAGWKGGDGAFEPVAQRVGVGVLHRIVLGPLVVDGVVAAELAVAVPYGARAHRGGAVRSDAIQPGRELRVAAEAPDRAVGAQV